ncbi:MAG: pyrimidine utilization protein D [Acetobacteraceae bacterium]|nr:pyrimidine utilization protein D [Acetobacteraceae bacterium]
MKFELSGPPGADVVLVSAGLGGLASFWAPQIAELQPRFRILRFDQRGTGANREALPEPYSITHMADDMAEVMASAGVSRAHILGHALGGIAALECARRHPARVGRLVLVNAWAKADRHTETCFDIRLGILGSQGEAAYVRAQPLFLHTAPYLSAHADQVAEEAARGIAGFQGEATIRARIAALRAFDIRADLPRIAHPALVAAARDDLLVPWTASQELARGLPNGRLWLAEHGGHAFTVEDPVPFNAALRHFLED